jgi:hypothetical protein
VEGDAGSIKVGWDYGLELGIKDNMELDTKDGIQFDIKHVVKSAQIALLK